MKKIKIIDNKSWQVVKHTQRYKVAIMVLEPGESIGFSDIERESMGDWMYVAAGSGAVIIDNEPTGIEHKDLFLFNGRKAAVIHNTGRKPLGVFHIYPPPQF